MRSELVSLLVFAFVWAFLFDRLRWEGSYNAIWNETLARLGSIDGRNARLREMAEVMDRAREAFERALPTMSEAGLALAAFGEAMQRTMEEWTVALERDCEHDDRGIECPVCDVSFRERARLDAERRKRERAAMFGYPPGGEDDEG